MDPYIPMEDSTHDSQMEGYTADQPHYWAHQDEYTPAQDYSYHHMEEYAPPQDPSMDPYISMEDPTHDVQTGEDTENPEGRPDGEACALTSYEQRSCFRCFKKGHLARECREQLPQHTAARQPYRPLYRPRSGPSRPQYPTPRSPFWHYQPPRFQYPQYSQRFLTPYNWRQPYTPRFPTNQYARPPARHNTPAQTVRSMRPPRPTTNAYTSKPSPFR